jgi:hypothetical protein
MAEDLSKYLDDGDEPHSVRRGFVSRTKSKPKSKTYDGGSGWNPNSKPRTRLRDNGETGTGRKSSGARPRCQMDGCQAFQSPARSGYCSWHESQHLAPGETPKVLRSRKCRDCSNLCSPPVGTDDESILCDGCAYFQNHPDEWSLDSERP